jgi:hypothetical protein
VHGSVRVRGSARGRIGVVDFYVRMARTEHFRTRTP